MSDAGSKSLPECAAKPVGFAPDAACAECGVHGASEFDGVSLCAACYSARGSCCAEVERPRG